MPTTQAATAAAAVLRQNADQSPARRDDPDKVLWSGRKTRFLIDKYKENFGNNGKKELELVVKMTDHDFLVVPIRVFGYDRCAPVEHRFDTTLRPVGRLRCPIQLFP
ncbi:hypothetical protein MRX96_037655 [Rhipicephalus microplus]